MFYYSPSDKIHNGFGFCFFCAIQILFFDCWVLFEERVPLLHCYTVLWYCNYSRQRTFLVAGFMSSHVFPVVLPRTLVFNVYNSRLVNLLAWIENIYFCILETNFDFFFFWHRECRGGKRGGRRNGKTKYSEVFAFEIMLFVLWRDSEQREMKQCGISDLSSSRYPVVIIEVIQCWKNDIVTWKDLGLFETNKKVFCSQYLTLESKPSWICFSSDCQDWSKIWVNFMFQERARKRKFGAAFLWSYDCHEMIWFSTVFWQPNA